MPTSPDPLSWEPQSWHPEGTPPADQDAPKWRWDLGAAGRRHAGRGRRPLILLLYLSLLAVTVLVIWVCLWLRPAKGTALVLVGAGYEDNLAVPHNVYGREGLKALAKLARNERPSLLWHSGRLRLQHEPRELTDVEKWAEGLRNIPEKTVVVFLALHGGADRQGAYLLPQRALLPLAHDSNQADLSRLRLDDVLARLEKMPRHQQVVLVLDATQMTSNRQLGMVHNDFARALDRLDARIAAIPNLIVLSASAADQRSWASDELQRTAFAYYLAEGLRGAADGAGGEPRDGRISALELYHYVGRRVQHWAAVNRGALQTPVLYPSGPAGEGRARAIKLGVVQRDAAPNAGPRPVFEPPGELLAAWQDCDRLARQVPPPATYSPHLWRLYQETLLRCEQLLQAGDAEGPRVLAGRLRSLAQAIDDARRLPLDSVANSTAMPALAGAEMPEVRTLRDAFAKLWTAAPDKVAESWAQLNAEHNPTGDKVRGQLLRLRCAEMLLREVTRDLGAQGPPQALERTYSLLRLTEEPVSPHRPAEAHYLVMLRDYLPRIGPTAAGPLVLRPQALQLALRVRLRAEHAALALQGDGDTEPAPPGERHCHAEQVYPWTRPLIEEADTHRRSGQDLLFATDLRQRQTGEELLAQADRGYAKAEEAAGRVRHALAVRDQVLAMLPFYARWVAQPPAPGAGPDLIQAKQKLLEKVEEVGEATQALGQSLESVAGAGEAPLGPAIDAATHELQAQADEVRRAFQEIEGAFTQRRNSLEESDQVGTWREIDDVLLVPFSDARVRQVLLTRRSRMAERFLVEADRGETDGKIQWSEADAREVACREGRLALALLGKRWFDESGGPDRISYDEVLRRLTRPGAKGDWRESLAVAGDEIGRHSRDLPQKINRHASDSRTVAAAPARAALRAADRLARQTDVAGSLFLGQNPADAYRRVLAQDLLVWQAERTYRDHWFDEDPAREPYYGTAGRAYLADAERLGPSHPALAGLKDKLRPARLEVVLHAAPGFDSTASAAGPSALHLTSEQEFPLTYRLQAAGGLAPPDGHPVLWIEAGPALEILDPAVERRALPWSEKGEEVLRCTLRSPLPAQAEVSPPPVPRPVETALTVHGFYRGQPLQVRTRIDVHPLADNILVNHPLPPRADVAVRAPASLHDRFGDNTAALAIVLDCSGSMRPPPKQEFSDKTKFVQATAALRQVLQKVPRGTTVSLWVFGQAIGVEKSADKAENTIVQILQPVTWKPEDPAQLVGLMASVDYPALEPWNESPIVRAMVMAARKDLRGARGFKSMLVLTDGIDNRFDKDAEYNPDGKDLATVFREEFRDIEVNIVGFKVASREMAKAREQFQTVEKLPRPGKFYLVNETAELVQTMEKVLRQRMRYWVDREDDLPLRGTGGELYATQDDANDQWLPGGLAPGSYKVRVRGVRDYARSIALGPGDLLLLEAAADRRPGAEPSALDFRRLLYSETYYGGKPKKDQGRWRAAVLQNQWLDGRRLQMLLALERRDDPEVITLRQVRPVLTWVELSPPPGEKTPFCQRWYYQAGYPAPAWNIDVPSWPVRGGADGLPLRPELRVWWSPDLEPSGVSLERGHDFTTGPQEVVNKPLRLRRRAQGLEDEPIVVESVRFEEHLVETRPAYRDRPARFEKKPCLVVRVSHANERPVWIRPVGLAPAGEEHRYYKEAAKYTALFWPVTPQSARDLQRLEVVSLTGFKASARQREFHLHMDNLYDPQPSDERPPFPVDLSAAEGSAAASAPGQPVPVVRPLGPPVRDMPRGNFLLDPPGQLPVLPNTPGVNPEAATQEPGEGEPVGPVVKPRPDLGPPWLPGRGRGGP